MTKRLLAIDPGTKSMGVAFFNSASLLVKTLTISTKLKDRYERTQDICSQLLDTLDAEQKWDYNSKTLAVCCEEPMMQGKANTAMQRLLGCLEQMFSAKISYIHPMTVKKILGSGSLDKLEVALSVGNKVSTVPEKEIIAAATEREAFDETDAAAIGFSHIGRQP